MAAYSWYDGGLHSRIDINTDLPARLPNLAQIVAHETYPGHHLERASKDLDLVERGRVESSIVLINTPECLISEGMADLGVEFAFPPTSDRLSSRSCSNRWLSCGRPTCPGGATRQNARRPSSGRARCCIPQA